MVELVTKIDPITKKERHFEKGFDDVPRSVRVVPANDQLRKFLKHGVTRVGFPKQGSAEWPNDTFTHRRIKDGDVTVEKPKAKEDGDKPKKLEAKKKENEAPAEQKT